MTSSTIAKPLSIALRTSVAATVALAVPVLAGQPQGEDRPAHQAQSEGQGSDQSETQPGAPSSDASDSARHGPPPGVARGEGGPPFKPVFDETWATVGIGAGLVPSYSGSDDFRVFPLPLIVGRVAGVGISPNGPGFNLDLLSQGPTRGPAKTSFSIGPSFRFRNDRTGGIKDNVVALAGELDTAVEVGVNGGVSFPGVLTRFDRLSLSTQVRWDILGAHDGMLIEPGVSYFRPIGTGAALQLSASASFVDDEFADYYYSISPAQSAASGLPQFQADGGLNSLGALGILTVDLDNNVLNGGFNVYAIGGYSRLVGDGADTPFTSIRGSADQFIGGIGIGYTF
ncbi:MAG: MipA/OmpV family protein [Erythrobacter sp.]